MMKLLQRFFIFQKTGSTAPNMNIAAGILTNISAFTKSTYTFVFVCFVISKFPNIRWIITSKAYLCISAYFNTLSNAHTNKSWTSGRIIRIMVIEEHSGVSIIAEMITYSAIFMSSRRIEHGERWLHKSRTFCYFVVDTLSFCLYFQTSGSLFLS